jgi:probable rRNA maturation factor
MIITDIENINDYKFNDILDCAMKVTGNTQVKIDVNLNFVSKDEIQVINKQYRGVDNPTDVLSFPLLDLKPGDVITKKEFIYDYSEEYQSICIGDIVICTDIAKEQAVEYEHSYERELYYLFVHGVLHLLGYDHMTIEDKEKMRQKEEEILDKFNLSLK